MDPYVKRHQKLNNLQGFQTEDVFVFYTGHEGEGRVLYASVPGLWQYRCMCIVRVLFCVGVRVGVKYAFIAELQSIYISI